MIVAIDGPAGSGKGTVSKILADKFDLLYIDTGATYRCVTLKFLQENVDLKNKEKIKQILENIDIEQTKDGKFFLDGKDVSKEIREKNVNENVSQIAHIKEVRIYMADLQRKMAFGKDAILEGRDIGTNVFKDADVKIYLDASVDERVKRRLKQNKEKNITDISEEEVRKNIIFRDENDKTAEIAPLKKADDAIYIDSSNLTINQVVDKISKIIKKNKRDNKLIESAYKEKKETFWKKFQRGFWKHLFAFLYRLVFRVKVIGGENLIPDEGEGLIICPNHLNYLDAAAIVLLNKQKIRFVAKTELFTHRFLHYLGGLFDIIPIKPNSSDVSSIKLCLKCLKNKEILGIFPEGTRRGLEKHTSIKNGACFLAYKTKTKIVPVGIKGSFKPFSTITLTYGEKIDISKYKTDDPDWINNATNDVMNKIIELSK